MWTVKHDSRTREHVQLLARDIAISLTSGKEPALDAQSFYAFSTCLQQSISRALTSLARDINKQSTICRLPAELLSHIASFLALPALCCAAVVCQHWRTVTLEDARLWRSVNVHLCANSSKWSPVLTPLLERSRMFPVRLELSMQCAAHSIDAILNLLSHHMQHLSQLSLGIPPGGILPFFALLQMTPAPMLERLRVLVPQLARAAGMPPHLFNLPSRLLAGHAPRLHTLYIQSAILPPAPGPAVARVRHLTYDHTPGVPNTAAICASLAQCPLLETLVLSQGANVDAAPPAEPTLLSSVRTLRLLDLSPAATDALLLLVPAATAVTLSFGADVPPEGGLTVDAVPPRLRALFAQHGPIHTLDVRAQSAWCHTSRAVQDLPSVCALTINGARVAVDVVVDLLMVLTQEHRDELGLQHVAKLHVSRSCCYWLAAAWPALTGLRELGIYMDEPGDEDLELGSCGATIEVVRFVEDLPEDAPPNILDAMFTEATVLSVIEQLRSASNSAQPLQRLVISGFPAVRLASLSGVAAEVIAEPVPVREDHRWWWDFSLLHSTVHV